MLAEVLADRGEWVQVMPGARACLFSLEESPFPLHLPLHLDHLHFETLFCQSGTMALTRRDGSALRLGARQVLLLTDLSGLAGARVDTPLAGILVAVDARGARGSLDTICDLLGGLNLDTGQVRRWMARREGCAVEGPTHWSRAAFADLDRLPRSEQARWCVWKSVELLYLLSAQEEETPDAPPSPALDPPVYGGASGRAPHHPNSQPPCPALCHDLQERVSPHVRPTCPHMAAAATDGTGGEAAARLLPQCTGGSPGGGIRQCQPVQRCLSAAVWTNAGPIPKKCLKRHNLVHLGDTWSSFSAIIF